MISYTNIIITGFMGTGKTSVGRETADRMGREFVDTDRTIEILTSKSVKEIFATEGEPCFRKLESATLKYLARRQRLATATGGGALLTADNVKLVSESGIIFCLKARPEILAGRLRNSSSRPLIQSKDLEQTIADLLAQRQAGYDILPNHIDTSELTHNEVAAEIITRYQRLTQLSGAN